ncbi:MAG: hypothetical protein GY953_21405 [bacterium]|nr:hypothetical protein [bacterium]
MSFPRQRIQLPDKDASLDQLADFFDHYDGIDLVEKGIMEEDLDRQDLDRVLASRKQKASSGRQKQP